MATAQVMSPEHSSANLEVSSPKPIDMHVHVVGNGTGGTGCWLRMRSWHRPLAAMMLRQIGLPRDAMSGDLDRLYVERLLDQVREGTRGTGVPDEIASALSARELEVLLLLDEHLATEEIAKRLFISEHTVRSHVKSLLRKLGVSSRREALEALAVARR